MAFFGQHEHRRLTVASAQLELLDGFCGPAHMELRQELARAHARVKEVGRELDELRGRAGSRDRDLDLLRFELDEIEALGPTVDERSALGEERERLRRVDALRAAAAAGGEALAPESGDGSGAAVMLAEAERMADAVAGVDPALDALVGADAGAAARGGGPRGATCAATWTGWRRSRGGSSRWRSGLRSTTGSSASTAAAWPRCSSTPRPARRRIEELENAEVATERAEAALAEAEERRQALAAKVGKARRAAGPKLAKRVRAELALLAMEDAAFDVVIEERDEIGPAGGERVELMLAPNAGVAAAPVRDAASGGELSRVMLALMTVAGARGAPTLVFDEVDAGVGGQTARAVGERLRRLGEERQVLCITHLPQIAALAQRHFRIEKSAAGKVARASVEKIEDSGVVEELCRMLGADSSDAGARRHAKELLAAA